MRDDVTWVLACPKCHAPSDITLDWGDEAPDFQITGPATLTCRACGYTSDVERWPWERKVEAAPEPDPVFGDGGDAEEA